MLQLIQFDTQQAGRWSAQQLLSLLRQDEIDTVNVLLLLLLLLRRLTSRFCPSKSRR
jgi:hypothetical protein